jgi:endonuclease/exonuclease/phosphatase family metal-dependent hydrolase
MFKILLYPFMLLSTVYFFSQQGNSKQMPSLEWSDPIPASSGDDFTLLSFNTWGLPVRLAGHDQNFRFKQMPNYLLKSNADVLCLQECFSSRLRYELEDLSSTFNTRHDFSCKRQVMGFLEMDCNGGLITLSKYPIIEESFIPFHKEKGRNWIEKIGAKGFLITTIVKGRDTLNIVNTHLYSGNNDEAERMRLKQAMQLNTILDTFLISHPFTTVLAGDLNITHPDVVETNDRVKPSVTYEYLQSNVCFQDSKPEIDSLDYTIDPQNNMYSSKKDGGQQKLDYCMLLNTGLQQRFTFDASTVIFKEDNSISDHMGLLTTLKKDHNTNVIEEELWVSNQEE